MVTLNSFFTRNRLIKQWMMVIFLGLAGMVNAQADTLKSSVNRANIEMGDIITLVIQTDFSTFSTPDFSELDQQFEILGQQRSTQMSMTNGHVSSYTRWDLNITPLKEGHLTIPAFEVSGVKSKPIKLNVKPASSSKQRSGVSFLESEVSTKNPYVQQEVIYTLRFYHLGVLAQGGMRPPVFNHSLSQVLVKQHSFETKMQGNLYEVFEWKWAFYPQKSGEMTIPASQFSGQVRYSGLIKRLQNTSQAIQLQVKPIPASYPKDQAWLPAKQVELVEQWQQPAKVRVGDSVTRTLQIQAQDLQASQLPNLIMDRQTGFQSYADKPQLSNQPTEQGFTSTATYKIAIVPTQAGELLVPALSFPWWNTQTDSLERASLPQHKITVLPSLVKKATNQSNLPTNKDHTIPKLADSSKEGLQVSRETDSIYWPILTALFALLWLLSSILWWRCHHQKKQIESLKPKVETADHGLKLPELANLIQTCQQLLTDIKQLNGLAPAQEREQQKQLSSQFYQAIKQWQASQPVDSEGNEALTKALANLQAYLFGKAGFQLAWLEDCLQQLTLQRKQAKKTIKKKEPKLEKLYLSD